MQIPQKLKDAFGVVQQKFSSVFDATLRFYRANTAISLSAFTIFSVLLIMWARIGFTFDVSRFFAAEVHTPSALNVQCGATQNVLTWTLPAGHDSNSIIRNVDGGTGVWVCGGPSNIAPCTTLSVATYTDRNIQPGHTYAYRHKAWADTPSNTVTCSTVTAPTPTPSTTSTPTPTPSLTPTPTPLIPPAGTILGACTGGRNPVITVRYSKFPPPGGDQTVNSNGMNKTTTPLGGTPTVVQLPDYNPVDRGQYWEFQDSQVISGYTYSYRAKYTPAVGTNTITFVASEANCGPSLPPPSPTPSTTPTPISTPTPSATPTPSPTPLVCAPATQTVAAGQVFSLTAQGGTGVYQWTYGASQTATGAALVTSLATPGTSGITLTSGGQSTTCQVIVQPAVVARGTAAVSSTGKNVSTNGVESSSVQVRTGQQLQVLIRARNAATQANITGVLVRSQLPEGLVYVPGSTLIAGVAAGSDVIVTTGLPLGAIGPGQEILVTYRATVNAAAFAVGTTGVRVQSSVQATDVPGASDDLDVVVTKPTPGTSGTVQTGPGDALLAAFLVSSIITLLYVSYTHTSTYKRHEIGAITEDRDPLDFRS